MKKRTKRITLGAIASTLAVTAPIVAVISCGKEEASSKLFKTGEIDMKALFKTMENNIEQNEIKRVPWITTEKNKKIIEKNFDDLTKLALEVMLDLPNVDSSKLTKLQKLNSHFPTGYKDEAAMKNELLGRPSKSIEEYKGKVKGYLDFIKDDARYGTIVLYNPKTNKEILKKVYSKKTRKEVLEYSKKTATRIFNDANDYGKMLVDLWANPMKAAEKYSQDQLWEAQEHFNQTLEELKSYTRKVLEIMFPPKQTK